MSEELDKAKRVLEQCLGLFESLRYASDSQNSHDLASLGARVITDFIDPPPDLEEVEECAGWVTINMHGDGKPVIGGMYLTEDRNKIPDHPSRITVQEIRVKVKRPVKRPVVKEVDIHIYSADLNYPPEIRGKTGTFRYTD